MKKISSVWMAAIPSIILSISAQVMAAADPIYVDTIEATATGTSGTPSGAYGAISGVVAGTTKRIAYYFPITQNAQRMELYQTCYQMAEMSITSHSYKFVIST